MKSKRLLMMLLLAFFVPLATFAQQSLPYNYGFEVQSNDELLADGWSLQECASSTGSAAGNAIHGGSRGFQFFYGSNPVYNQYLISPELTVPTGGARITFWYKNYSTSYNATFKVGYSTTDTDLDSFTWSFEITTATNQWQQSVPYECPAGTKYVAICCLTNWYFFVDDFSVTTPSPQAVDPEYTYGFETTSTEVTDGWTTLNRAQYTGNYGNNAIHTGSKGFEFQGNTTAATSTQYLISPEMNGTNGLAFQFYYKCYAGSTHTFRVGYSATPNISDFTWGEFNTKNNSDWVLFDLQTCDAGYKYVAVECTSTTSYLFIDDFSITVPPLCEMPETLEASSITTNGADLIWTGGSGTYNVEYKLASETEWISHATNLTTTSTTLTDLTSGTNYHARVQSVCKGGAELSGWKSVEFTTECEAYTLPYAYGFEDANDMICWTLENCHTNTGIAGGNAYHDGSKGLQFQSTSATGTQYLISPELDLNGANGVAVSFWYKNYNASYPATYMIGYSTTTNASSAFTWGEAFTVETGNTDGWEMFADETLCPDNTKYVAIACTIDVAEGYNAWAFVDDISFYERPGCLMPTDLAVTYNYGTTATATWSGNADSYDIEVNGEVTENVTTPHTMENLTLATDYTVRVRANCGTTQSEWTPEVSFTTLPKAFVTAGDWDNDNNWVPAGAPTYTENVAIMANASINNGVVAEANTITINGGSITIKDGGQLKHNTTGLQVTLEKNIENWNNDGNGEDKPDGWYLIANPLTTSAVATDVTGLLDNDKYDLYRFWAGEGEDYLEWINYRNGAFDLIAGYSYLYANEEDVTLNFTGTVYPSYNKTYSINFTAYNQSSTAEFNGWRLVGNLFACNGYVKLMKNGTAVDANFYVMNEAGDDFVISESSVALAPCQGAFIYAEEAYDAENNPVKITYTTVAPEPNPEGRLCINLSENQAILDKARISFGESSQLPKMSLRQNSSKVYIPQGNRDFAVVHSNGQGEMPVNFKAEHNGTFTLNFDSENVEFNSLHLIDNMTGANVDLMANPSYTFEAKTTDYASRFRLVFSTNNVDESNANFAYYNGSEWVVNASANATVQVVDMMGRVVRNGEAARHIATEGMTQGVYVIRLIDGDNVKTQKIVVK